MEAKIEIPLSKSKMGLLFSGSVGFVFLGFLFLRSPEDWLTNRIHSTVVIRILGSISILFFGIIGVSIGKKFFDKKMGLIIDDQGITDNSSGNSVGLIEWEDIVGIDHLEVATNKFLLIKTDKPEKYIEKAKSWLSKRAMKTNYKMYGSPISISASSLKIGFHELETLLNTEFRKRKAGV